MVLKYCKMISAMLVLFAAAVGQRADAVAFCNPLSDKTIGECDGSGGRTFDSLIDSIINFLFGLALIVCPILMVWGGFLIATAAGEEKKVSDGRRIITYAAVGLVVIAAAGAIKWIILDIVNS